MGIRICTLASGSSANCTYVEAGNSRFLIDTGLSGRSAASALEAVGACEPGELDGILVTHEHADHIRGVGVLARRHGIPVHVNPGTRAVLEPVLGPRVKYREFSTGRAFDMGSGGAGGAGGRAGSNGGVSIMPFPISHDAAEPVGFIIEAGRRKAVVATDMGVLHPMTRSRFRGAHVMVFESNHDPLMLDNGPYPLHLKARIRSSLGHLSNEDSATHLARAITDDTASVLLAHLSENNNTPVTALGTVSGVLGAAGWEGVELAAAPRHVPSAWLETD